MKKILCLLAVASLCLCGGCSRPDSQTLDLSWGYGQGLKLLHLNASTEQNRQRMEGFARALEEADPLEKDFSLFAYYPDYRLELTENGQTTAAIVDVNGDYIDFFFLNSEQPQLYRSRTTAEEFRALVHQN